MCRTSTIPVNSCSDPIGRWTATHFSSSCSLIEFSERKKSARSRSSMLTKRTRARPSSEARCQTREVPTSTPITPLSTKSAPSTTWSAAIASPWKPGSPGASIRLIFRSCQFRWASAEESDIWRLCSSSSQSVTVVPPSIVPRRFTAPVWKSRASTSDVLPTPRCPTTATLRIFPGSWAMRECLLGGLTVSASILPPLFRDGAEPRERRQREGLTLCGQGEPDETAAYCSRRARRARDPDARPSRPGQARLGRYQHDEAAALEPAARASDGARLALERGTHGRAGQARLQAKDRLRVELRHPRLGDTEHFADLAQRQLLVVVERDHELLALREARDRVRDHLLHLGGVEGRRRRRPVGVLDRVDQRDLVAAGARDRPELVEGGDRRP